MSLYNILIKDRSQTWIALATIALAFFSYFLWRVDQRIAQDSEAIQRAFVFIKDITGERLSVAEAIASVDFTFSFENGGTTPPRHMLTHLSHSYQSAPLPDDYGFPDLWDPGQPHIASLTAIGPKGTSTIGPVSVSAPYIAAMLNHRMHLYFWGWLKYSDVFAQTAPHLTEFCYELGGFEGNIFSTDSSKPVFPIFHNCPKHNCYEDDCPDYKKMTAP